MERVFFLFGTLSALVGVAAGAFGAHGLKDRLDPEMLSIFEVGVRYQMYHAFALIAAAWSQAKWPSRLVTIGGWMFVVGTRCCTSFRGTIALLPWCRKSHGSNFDGPSHRCLHAQLAQRTQYEVCITMILRRKRNVPSSGGRRRCGL